MWFTAVHQVTTLLPPCSGHVQANVSRRDQGSAGSCYYNGIQTNRYPMPSNSFYCS